MSTDVETFDNGSLQDSIYSKQKEGVSKMRASLLACNPQSGSELLAAINSITAMRIYHQVSRIIRYTEMMDKLEDTLYNAMNNTIDNMNMRNGEGLGQVMILIGIQEKLQKSMIESHKLLQPYMDVKDFAVVDLVDASATPVVDSGVAIMDSSEREQLRNAAQTVLNALNAPKGNE